MSEYNYKIGDKVICNGNPNAVIIDSYDFKGSRFHVLRMQRDNGSYIGQVCMSDNELKIEKQRASNNN
jgi:hypothetical protein